MKRVYLFFIFVIMIAPRAFGDTHDHHGHHHDHSSHDLIYVDPLAVEHAFLDNKLRFDFGYENRSEFERQDQPINDEGETTQEGLANIASYGLLLEWALSERIGIGIETSLLQVDALDHSNTAGFGNTEVEVKFLPILDEENYFVTALSFGVGIPTGNEDHGLGEGRVELEPGLLFFKKIGGVVVQAQYILPIELGSGQNPVFFNYNHSFAYPLKVSDEGIVASVVPMFEILGSVPLNGESKGNNQLSLMPGFRVNLPHEASVGFAVKFPVGRYADNEAEILATFSKHFD